MTVLVLIMFSQLAVLVMVLAAVMGRGDRRGQHPGPVDDAERIRAVEQQTMAALLSASADAELDPVDGGTDDRYHWR